MPIPSRPYANWSYKNSWTRYTFLLIRFFPIIKPHLFCLRLPWWFHFSSIVRARFNKPSLFWRWSEISQAMNRRAVWHHAASSGNCCATRCQYFEIFLGSWGLVEQSLQHLIFEEFWRLCIMAINFKISLKRHNQSRHFYAWTTNDGVKISLMFWCSIIERFLGFENSTDTLHQAFTPGAIYHQKGKTFTVLAQPIF